MPEIIEKDMGARASRLRVTKNAVSDILVILRRGQIDTGKDIKAALRMTKQLGE